MCRAKPWKPIFRSLALFTKCRGDKSATSYVNEVQKIWSTFGQEQANRTLDGDESFDVDNVVSGITCHLPQRPSIQARLLLHERLFQPSVDYLTMRLTEQLLPAAQETLFAFLVRTED